MHKKIIATKKRFDFDEIRNRIFKEMLILTGDYSPTKWGEIVCMSMGSVNNIHSETKQNPSLRYIIEVAMATKKPIGYFMWGENSNRLELIADKEDQEYLKKTCSVFKSKTKTSASLKEYIEFLHGKTLIESKKKTADRD